MNTNTKSCKDCQDRAVSCHCTCESYKERKAQHEAEKERIRQAKAQDNNYMSYKAKAVRDAKRKSER